MAQNSTKLEAEKFFGCCGFDDNSTGYMCDQVPECKVSCSSCKVSIEDKIDSAFDTAGGLGLFFAFTEVNT